MGQQIERGPGSTTERQVHSFVEAVEELETKNLLQMAIMINETSREYSMTRWAEDKGDDFNNFFTQLCCQEEDIIPTLLEQVIHADYRMLMNKWNEFKQLPH